MVRGALAGTCAVALLSAVPVQAGLFHHHHKAKASDQADETPAPGIDATQPSDGPAPTSPSTDSGQQYDEVGYAGEGGGQGSGEAGGVSISHSGLPAQSFVEVTNLDSGKTIVAIVSGPVAGGFAALSPTAATMLGTSGARTPVRVRRVYPPMSERAALLAGQAGGNRLDTPDMLLVPLRHQLTGQGAATPTPMSAEPPSALGPRVRGGDETGLIGRHSRASGNPDAIASSGGHFVVENAGANPEPIEPVEHAPPASPPSTSGGIYIQVISLSSEAAAQSAAHKLGSGASVEAVGGHYRVRLGPFASDAAARARLGMVAAHGYHGARITH